MSEKGGDDSVRERAAALSRLATLQRLRDHAKNNRREAMLRTIEQMIDAEGHALWLRRGSNERSRSDDQVSQDPQGSQEG